MAGIGRYVMARCKACGSEIVWIKTKNDKLMPCNFPPVDILIDESEKEIYVTCTGKVVHGRRCDNKSYPIQAYVPHWATCPKAEQFRKKVPGR